MARIQLTWRDLRRLLDTDTDAYDQHGVAWRRTNGTAPDMLYRREDDGLLSRHINGSDPVWLDPPPIPEPPDGTRIEFEHHTDVYAAWRDDESSVRAGYPAGEGWCLFGATVPRSWTVMWLEFGDSLRTAVRLMPHPDDTGNYARWGTALMAARGGR